MKQGEVLKNIKSLKNTIAQKFLNSDNCTLEGIQPPSPTQMQIMEYIMEHDNNVYQKDLEDVLGIKRATVSGVLQTMEKNGLIDRVTDEDDTRTKRIMLKEKTLKIFEDGKIKFEKIENEMIKNISEEDLKVFLKVIKKMKENIEKV